MTLAIALRGDTPRFRENTIPALSSAIDQGADALAVDVALTTDGHPVCVRAAAAAELWRLDAPVSGLSLAELAAATSAGGHRIPTLMEVLAAAAYPRRVPLVADVRTPEAALAAAAVAAAHGATGSVLYYGPAPALEALTARYPQAGVAVDWDPGGPWPTLGTRPRYLHCRADRIDREAVAEAHGRGCGVGAGTVDDFAEMARLIGMGVDAVLTTEVAELATLTAEQQSGTAPRGRHSV
ncbi:glycerophosphodiester phosphodiesterase [Nocardiopsis coralliicola]